MKNEFIPYEEALALKELGFNEECMATYIKDEFFLGISSSVLNSDMLLAPLYQQAFRWFREKYNLTGHVLVMGSHGFKSYIFNSSRTQLHPDSKTFDPRGDNDPYQETELDCIRKLIEIVKSRK